MKILSLPKQVKKRSESTNFLTSLLTIIFVMLGFQGVEIPVNAVPELVDAIKSASTVTIVVALIPNVIVPGIKIIENIKENGFNWSFLSSTNFRIQLASTVFLLLELTGVFPPESGKVLAASAQTLNIGLHTEKAKAFLNKAA